MKNNFKDGDYWFDDLFVSKDQELDLPMKKRHRVSLPTLVTEGFTLATETIPISPIIYSSKGTTIYIASSSVMFVAGDVSYGLGFNPTITNLSSITLSYTTLPWKSVALTDRTFVGITTSNILYSCGYANYGMLGNGTNSSLIQSLISQVGSESAWNYVSCGDKHTELIKTTGTLWSVGDNTYGQLGDGTTVSKSTPVQVGTSTSWVSVSAGKFFTLALNSGKLYSWGDNTYGQLGDGTTVSKSTPVQVGTDDWSIISAKNNSWVGISSGKLWGAGENYNSSSPVQIGSDIDWIVAAQGITFGAGIRGSSNSGTLWVWGNIANITTSSPVQLSSSLIWKTVNVGGVLSVIDVNDKIFVFGENSSGQLGIGSTTTISSLTQISGSWNLFASSNTSSIWVNNNGILYGAGSNWFGQLLSLPKVIVSGLTYADGHIATLAGGVGHTIFIKDDGTLWGLGLNASGQCGQSDLDVIYSSPIQIGSRTDWSKVYTSEFSSFAIDTSGRLWGWGDNYHSNVAFGLGDKITSPTQIGTATNWLKVYASKYVTHGIQGITSGTLWGWGYDNWGSIGDGVANTVKLSPVQIGTDASWTQIASVTVPNGTLTAGIKAAGTLWGWGYDADYDLFGPWFSTQTSTPVQLGSATNWSTIVPGAYTMTFLNSSSQRIERSILVGTLAWGSLQTTNYGVTSVQNFIGYKP